MANKRAAKRCEETENAVWNQQATRKEQIAAKHDGDREETSKHVLVTLEPVPPQIAPATPSPRPCSTKCLFIVSLGNPAPHENSWHSAGHIILKELHSRLGFTNAKRPKIYARGLVSEGVLGTGTKLALWQCTSSMNDSGTFVLKAYRSYTTTTYNPGTGNLSLLVLLHDEMEAAPGDLRVSSRYTSAREHHGVKSVQQSFQSAGLRKLLTESDEEAGFVRIGVGIGRLAGASRQKGDIADYVLGTLSENERKEMEQISARKLVAFLEEGIR